MKTILAPADFSSVSYNACLYAAKLAEDIKAELVLLHVMELPVTVTEFPMTEKVFDEMYMQKELEALEKKLLADHRLASLNPKFHSVEDEDILKGIDALAETEHTDLLVIIPKKHGMFHKSRSRDFIFYSHLPVMAIHENDVAEHA